MPMYPEIMLMPMREELTRAGVEELRTPEAVDAALSNQPGTSMVIVNSVCGCAAGKMRPPVRQALQNGGKPHKSTTGFAGHDPQAPDKQPAYSTGAFPA